MCVCCVCICVCVLMYVYRDMHPCMCVCITEAEFGCFLFFFFLNWKGYFVSWDQNCPWNVELENWARLAGQWAREILLSLSPQITSTCLHFLLFTWLLRSSHLRAKHFTHWIISLVLKHIPLRDLKGSEGTGILFPVDDLCWVECEDD